MTFNHICFIKVNELEYLNTNVIISCKLLDRSITDLKFLQHIIQFIYDSYVDSLLCGTPVDDMYLQQIAIVELIAKRIAARCINYFRIHHHSILTYLDDIIEEKRTAIPLIVIRETLQVMKKKLTEFATIYGIKVNTYTGGRCRRSIYDIQTDLIHAVASIQSRSSYYYHYYYYFNYYCFYRHRS